MSERHFFFIILLKKLLTFKQKKPIIQLLKNNNLIQEGACTVKNHWLQDNREKGENPLRSRHCVGEAGLFYVTGKPGRQAVPMNLSQDTCLFVS